MIYSFSICKCMSFTAGSSGGEYKHPLGIDELPDAIWHANGGVQQGGLKQHFTPAPDGSGINTRATNFNHAHNNIQPYTVIYYWKRTA